MPAAYAFLVTGKVLCLSSQHFVVVVNMFISLNEYFVSAEELVLPQAVIRFITVIVKTSRKQIGYSTDLFSSVMYRKNCDCQYTSFCGRNLKCIPFTPCSCNYDTFIM